MISIKRTTTDDPSVNTLINQLDKELWERYPTEQGFFDNFNILPADARVVMALDDDKAVGCGAFKPVNLFENAVEIKRMYVDAQMRGRAIGVLVLESLESWAKEEGFSMSILETGDNQPEAIRLYEKMGYTRIDNFEPYVGVKSSICYEKKLE